MKFFLKISSIILVGLLIERAYNYIKFKNISGVQQVQSNWKTIRLVHKKVTTTTTDASVAASLEGKKPTHKKLNRQPANSITRQGRPLVGTHLHQWADPNTPLTFINQTDPDWENHLSNHIMRFMPPETIAYFKKERSYIQIQGGKGRYMEEVVITYKRPNGVMTSFSASVDGQTGAIDHTWNKTILENREILKNELRASPSGGIYVDSNGLPYYQKIN